MYRFFESLIDPLRPTPACQPPEKTLPFFWFYLAPIKGVLLSTLVLSGIAALSELYVYIYLGRILDWMSEANRASFLSSHSTALIWMAVVVVLIRPMSMLATRAIINLAVAPGLANATRWQNHRYVLRQSMTFFQNDFAGRVAQKIMQTGHAVRESVLNIIDGAWMLVIYLLGTAIFFIEISSLLLIPVLIWMVAYFAVVLFMVPPVRRKSAKLSEENSVLMGRIVDSYTNIQSVKLFAHHSLEEDFAGDGILRHTRAFRVLMRAILQMTVTLTVLNTLLIAGTAAVSIGLWMAELITVGEIAVANGLVIRLNQMSTWVLRTITSLFENIGTVQNGIETLSQPLLIKDKPEAKPLSVAAGRICFNAVGFQYDEQGQGGKVVHDLSVDIKPGEKVGLVGKSGAGKSTLIDLLIRFHDVDTGSITIDDQDIRNVTQDSLRSNIAVVSQDTSLLHRSIRDNIRYGKSEATDEDILKAAQLAEAMSFIPELTDPQGRRGLDAHVGERGVKLSGGQRQRIAIARVILKNAPILILDEATSALDSEVEAAIQQQLSLLMEGKTVLAVAHRLSTIAALDKLVVLDQGHIVEVGTHAQLIEKGGLYARLWHRQSGGFLGHG
ncbi:MAG: ABC transporter ATP-binding protein [Granulosicoccus sp.]